MIQTCCGHSPDAFDRRMIQIYYSELAFQTGFGRCKFAGYEFTRCSYKKKKKTSRIKSCETIKINISDGVYGQRCLAKKHAHNDMCVCDM